MLYKFDHKNVLLKWQSNDEVPSDDVGGIVCLNSTPETALDLGSDKSSLSGRR